MNNTAVEAAIWNQGSTVNWTLNWMAVDIVHKALKLSVYIEPIHLTSAKNFLTDGASCTVWSLNQKAANLV